MNPTREWGDENNTKPFTTHTEITSITIKNGAKMAKSSGVAKNNLSPLRQSRRNAKSPGTLGRQGLGWAGCRHFKRHSAPARPGYFTRFRNTEGLSAWPRPVPSAIGSSRATLPEDTFAITELTGATPTDPSASTVSSYTVQTLLLPV